MRGRAPRPKYSLTVTKWRLSRPAIAEIQSPRILPICRSAWPSIAVELAHRKRTTQCADCVAKLDEEQLAGNNRIRTNKILNQHCVLGPNLESILLARALKIVLQQYLPTAEVARIVRSPRRPARPAMRACRIPIGVLTTWKSCTKMKEPGGGSFPPGPH